MTLPGRRIPCVFHHLPIIDATWAMGDQPEYERDEDFLIWAYQEMLTIGAPRFAAALTHCRARHAPRRWCSTALPAKTAPAYLRPSSSVRSASRTTTSSPTTLTVEGMERFRVWAAREWPEWFERMAAMPPAFTAALPEAMSHILDELCATHGTIRGFVKSIGVSEETLATLESVLLA